VKGVWLISYIILWALVLASTVAILALAREMVALQRELQIVRYQLAHEGETLGVHAGGKA
jgi:hypothetical protein